MLCLTLSMTVIANVTLFLVNPHLMLNGGSKSDVGLGQETIPQVHGQVGVRATEGSNEVIFSS